MAQTFRDAILKIVPGWLQARNGGRLLYAIAVQLDGAVDGLVNGVSASMPGRYTDESLPLLSRQRRIRRGPNENSEAFANRLKRWWSDHRRRGGPYAMLEQLRAFWAPVEFPIELVYRSGRRFSMDDDGAITRDDYFAWDPDTEPEKWARWWLFFHWPEDVSADGTWSSGGVWDDGGVWDSDLTVAEVDNIRAVPHEWNAGHCFGTVVLLTSDGRELWNYPQGVWDEPGAVWLTEGPAQLAIG
jgi:hypothetical protein